MAETEANANKNTPHFAIETIFTKDVSYECPHAAYDFNFASWEPEVNINLATHTKPVRDDRYEVILTVTTTVKVKDQTAFIAEVKEGGVFHVAGLEEAAMSRMLGSFCPNILFPYARELISSLVTRGGFPPLLLAPVDFDAVYEESLRQQQASSNDDAHQ